MQTCAALAGLGGVVPSDWPLLDVSERHGIAPWDLHTAPALWVERMMFRASALRQAERDRAENEKEER